MKLKNATVVVKDWITPKQVDYVKVATPSEQLDRIRQRANELREAMGPRYLFHEKNRVRRIDRPTAPAEMVHRLVRADKQAA